PPGLVAVAPTSPDVRASAARLLRQRRNRGASCTATTSGAQARITAATASASSRNERTLYDNSRSSAIGDDLRASRPEDCVMRLAERRDDRPCTAGRNELDAGLHIRPHSALGVIVVREQTVWCRGGHLDARVGISLADRDL